MTEPPSAEPDEPRRYRAVMLIDGGGGGLNTLIPALNDDDAKAEALALVDGHAIDLWDGLRFIERFEPTNPPADAPEA